MVLSNVQTWGGGGLWIGELPQPTSREHFRNDNILGNQGQSHWKNQVNLNQWRNHPFVIRLIETNSVVLRPNVTYPPTTNPTLLAEVPCFDLYAFAYSNIPFQGPGKDITYVQRMEASKHLIKSFGQQKGSRYKWENYSIPFKSNPFNVLCMTPIFVSSKSWKAWKTQVLRATGEDANWEQPGGHESKQSCDGRRPWYNRRGVEEVIPHLLTKVFEGKFI